MTALDLIVELARVGIRLEVVDGQHVRYRTPPGVAIAPYRERILAHKAEALRWLADPDRLRLAAASRIFGSPCALDPEPYAQLTLSPEPVGRTR